MKTAFLVLSALLLTACGNNTQLLLSPETTLKQTGTVLDKTNKQGSAARYLCKGEKVIRVVRNVAVQKKGKKVDAMHLTFNNVTEKLFCTVSETGKSYTNIHWHWIENSDSNTLTNTVGEVLAEECVLDSK